MSNTLDDHFHRLLETSVAVTRLIAKAAIERPEYNSGRSEHEAAIAMGDHLADLAAAMPAFDLAAKRLCLYTTSILLSRGEGE